MAEVPPHLIKAQRSWKSACFFQVAKRKLGKESRAVPRRPEGAGTRHLPAVEVAMGAVICSPVSLAVIRMFSKSWDPIFFLQVTRQ